MRWSTPRSTSGPVDQEAQGAALLEAVMDALTDSILVYIRGNWGDFQGFVPWRYRWLVTDPALDGSLGVIRKAIAHLPREVKVDVARRANRAIGEMAERRVSNLMLGRKDPTLDELLRGVDLSYT